MCRSASGKDTYYRKCRFIPPHQSLSRQLPPKGKPFCKIPFALHNKATRVNRKGKPQFKDIFDISAMYAMYAMFAQCKEGFPLGGKKTASSLSRQRLMRGDKSALTKGIHSHYAPHSPIVREAALFRVSHLPIHQKLPCTATAVLKRGKFSPTNPAVAVQGSSGR